MLKEGFKIQIATVILLVLQSFVLPVIIGVEKYGEGVFVLTPCLIIGAIYEPIVQSFYINHRNSKLGIGNIYFAFIVCAVLIAGTQVLIFFMAETEVVHNVIALLAGIVYLCSVLLQAEAYGEKKLRLIFSANIAGAFFLVVALLFFLLIGCFDTSVYLISFGVIQASIFAFLFFKGREVKYKTLVGGKKNIRMSEDLSLLFLCNILVEAAAWRGFFVLYTVGFVWLIGLFAGMEAVGETKIIFSLLTGARYLYPINTPLFHKLASESRFLAIKKLFVMQLIFLALCLSLYFFGNTIANYFQLSSTYFLFQDPVYYVFFPVLISSMAIGSVFVALGGRMYCIIASCACFLSSFFFMMFGGSYPYAFLLGMAVYLISFLLYIGVFGNVYRRRPCNS